MHWTNIGLIFVAGLSIGMAFFIYLRNPKNKINIWFAICVTLIGVWSFSVGMFREATTEISALIWSWVDNTSGSFLALFSLFLASVFPYQSRPFSKLQKVLIFLTSFGLVVLLILGWIMTVLIPSIWTETITLIPHNNIYRANFFYICFGIYIIFYLSWTFFNLFSKYKESEGIAKIQLKNLIIGALSISCFGIIFEIVLPILTKNVFYWLGPYLALVLIFYLIRIMFYKKIKLTDI